MRTRLLAVAFVTLSFLGLPPVLEAQNPARAPAAAPNQAQPAAPRGDGVRDSFHDRRSFRLDRMGRGTRGWQHYRAARYRAHWRRMQYRRSVWARGMRSGYGMRGRGFERGPGRAGAGFRHRGRGMYASPVI